MSPFRVATLSILLIHAAGCSAPADLSRYRLPHRPVAEKPAASSAQENIPVPSRHVPPVTIEHPPVSRTPPEVPRIVVPPVAVPPPAASQSPVPINACDAGGCWSGGQRYNGGTGTTYLDRNGHPCQANGAWLQCF